MSERGDSTYQPKRKTKTQQVPQPRRPVRSTRSEKDYSEPFLISDDSDDTVQGEVDLEECDLESTDDTYTPDSVSVKSEPWTPKTFTTRTNSLLKHITEFTEQTALYRMAKGPDTSMAEVLQMMIQMRTEDRAADLKREQERQRRDDDMRRDNERREDRLLAALKEAQPVVPQTVTIVNHKLPKMKPGEEIETFVGMFEAALRAGNVPENQWCAKLHAHLEPDTKLKIQDALQDPDATYQNIKDALLGCTGLSFNAAAETLLTVDRGRLLQLPIRQFIDKIAKLLEKVTKEAADEKEIYQYIAVAFARNYLNPTLKTYFDLKGEFSKEQCCRLVEEWLTNQPAGVPWHRKLDSQPSTDNKQMYRAGNTKKPGSCFHCGKPGHFSRECRSRLAQEKTQQQQPTPTPTPIVKTEVPDTGNNGRQIRREVTCFHCRQKGHKFPQCPLRQNQVKRIEIPSDKVVELKQNELFGAVGKHRLPITCDTGSDVTLVPEECVTKEQLTGDTCEVRAFNKSKFVGKVCNIDVTVHGKVFHRKAVTQPGESLAWTVCLNLPYSEQSDLLFILEEMKKKASLSDQETHYMPPEWKDGALRSGVLVSEGTVVEPEEPVLEEPVTQVVPVELPRTEPEPESERVEVVNEVAGEMRESELDLAEVNLPSDLAEVAGDPLRGGASSEGMQDLSVQGMKADMPRTELAKATSDDKSLQHLYKLATLQKDGYYFRDGILLRTRLDVFGQTTEQICLPTPYRQKCLHLAHNNFGHQGRTKMTDLIRPFFHWPSMTRDCLAHVRSCDVCQRTDKANPKPNMMQLREVTTIPFESVAIDLVGPFPTAVGGFKFLLTCIDNATRWPEAIPIRTTMAKTIIHQLTNIFTRCGFPTRLTSDNGSQFMGKTFQAWLKHHGIKHVRSAPYHPQGNGVIERLHRTLNAMISKIAEKKGNWATVTPMVLYFLRCTPSATTGLSPFMARQGWEPATPVQLLYKAWLQPDLGEIDLTEWVAMNAERVETAREKALLSKTETAGKRKQTWDKTARQREFEVGDEVLVRKPGLNLKLSESWEGPFVVSHKYSPLSYTVDMGDRKLGSVHVQLMKRYERAKEVKRVTSVLEGDTGSDDITERFSEAKVSQRLLEQTQQGDLDKILEQYKDVLTTEPGLTDIIEFQIDTGQADPIYQRAYNTPTSLKQSIDTEIDWLLSQGYIRPSTSPWSSPMVTVRKPDGTARLCVDFKRINEVTRQMPFYMPRVEEVLEGVGKARYISKLDLSKGYYQIKMKVGDIPKTAFICHRGKFEFLRMPFGVKNAPAAFQELMQGILEPHRLISTAYMDDIVIFSDSWEDHLDHIQAVLQTLRTAGLTANPRKCRWGGSSIEFLGHQVGGGKMSMPQHRVDALSTYTRPLTKKGLRAFMGSIGFYRRYVSKLADQTAILTPLTAKQAPQRVEWTEEGMSAFQCICNVISNSCSLCIPLPSDTFSIVTDASGKGIGGVLQVKRGDEWEAEAFYSRQLQGAEQRYSATELEALAVVATVDHFNYYLYGRQFCVFTDHRPLEQLLSSDRLNPRLRRMAYKLQHWMITIKYIPGVNNTFADALSREEMRTEEKGTPVTSPDVRLDGGSVEEQPPQREEEEWQQPLEVA